MGNAQRYAKFIVAVVGAGVTTALSLTQSGTTLFTILTIAASVLTAIGVYFVPNTDGATGK